MDESNIVSFGANMDNREDIDETIHEPEAHGSRSEMMNAKINEGIDGSKLEMKQAMNECVVQFSNKLEAIFASFENKLAPTNSTPIRGRGQVESPPRPSRSLSREDRNNSHVPTYDLERGPGKFENINCKIKPQFYDGSDDLEEYLTQFNLLAELNRWNTRTKALFLASSLSGGARALLNEMSDCERHSYEALVEALKSRFGSINRSEVFRAELQTRIRMRNETLPELAQAIKQLTRIAYPGTYSKVRDTLSLDYFIDAIPETEIRLRLREVCPKTINEAENIAVRLEALRIADRQKGKSVRLVDTANASNNLSGELHEIKDSLKTLRIDVNAIKNNGNNNKGYPNKPFNPRPWNNNGFNYNGRNDNFRRAENGQESRTRVSTRPNQTGPTR